MFAFLGYEKQEWVRSAYYFVNTSGGPGEGRPAAEIASFTATETAPGKIVVKVALEDPLMTAAPLETNAAVRFCLVPRGMNVLPCGGRLLQLTEPGVFEGHIEANFLDEEGRPMTSFTFFGFAGTMNRLDGSSYTEMLQIDFGDCRGGCLRESL